MSKPASWTREAIEARVNWDVLAKAEEEIQNRWTWTIGFMEAAVFGNVGEVMGRVIHIRKAMGPGIVMMTMGGVA